jgi:hypothetical protein
MFKWALVKQHIFKPILRRAGTAVAAFLLAKGVPPDLVDQIGMGITALGLIGWDLFLSKRDPKKNS